MKRLEVGSGNNPIPGYEHLDINPDLPDLQYIGSLDSIPCPDDTFDELLSIHSIEHISVERAKKALREWYRVLRPGGSVHIDTPNIRLNAELYVENSNRWMDYFNTLTPGEKELCSLNGVPNKTLWMNFKCFSSDRPYDTHYWNADPDLLTALCFDAGFSKVTVEQISPSVIVKAWK